MNSEAAAWVIYRLLPNFQRLPIAQFLSRSDAETSLQVLQHMLPDARFAIAFELDPEAIASSSNSIPSANPSSSNKLPLKILVFGPRPLVSQTLRSLHSLGFAALHRWSPLVPLQNSNDEVISVLVRYISKS